MKPREFIAAIGGAAVWPAAARAQQQAKPVIGVLSSFAEQRWLMAGLRQGLADQGFIEGRDVEILYRWAEERYERLPTLAADLVRCRVAVIITVGGGTASALAAKSATETIPIVFVVASDPVQVGLVASLNRPGGNLTGVSILGTELVGKRLELLHEIVPAAKSIGFLVDPRSAALQSEMKDAEIAAYTLGLRLVLLNAGTPDEIAAVFMTSEAQPIDALLTTGAALFLAQGRQLAALASLKAVPAIYHTRETVVAGGLMSYGASAADTSRAVFAYTGRILKGERPADLPVQLSTRIELVINRKTAKALGLTVPPNLLALADEVIE
jgi:putative tryptophan/tyrosine transport system substrate-binding protein